MPNHCESALRLLDKIPHTPMGNLNIDEIRAYRQARILARRARRQSTLSTE